MLAVLIATSADMHSIIKYLCLPIALLLTTSDGRCGAPDAAQAKAQLAQLRAQIAALTNRLGTELKDRDASAGRLREADLRLTQGRRRLDAVRAAELVAQRRHDALEAEAARTEHALEVERAALAGEVRAAYLIGRQEQLKLWLMQTDPASAGRMFEFYRYFARERGKRIDAIGAQVSRLKTLLADIDASAEALQALRASAVQEMALLQAAREERKLALAAVDNEVTSGTARLELLKRQEQAEESLVAELSRMLQEFPIDAHQSFAGLRGKLPWPVPGRMTAQTPDSRGPDAAQAGRWNGVLIETSRGAKVRALYSGRVLYADWLQGVGLLIIIGHSGNYMTLYGRAEVLYKSVGDSVAPGDVIAGLSDSSAAPQLYFEIREGRRTVDPKTWLKPTP
jgi:septal ring factor EnvC (AmiA/AmiB activator)